MKNNDRFTSGNALFLILIAVALFAALGFAVTKSRTSSSTIGKEKFVLDLSRVQQYFSYIRGTCQRMLLSGTTLANLDLVDGGSSGITPCTTGTDCVFAPEGGGAVAQTPPSGMGSGVNYAFFENGYGVMIDGVGTTDPDIVGALFPLTSAVCSQINVALGLGSAIPSVAPGLLLDGFPGKITGCIENGGNYIYYFTLIEN